MLKAITKNKWLTFVAFLAIGLSLYLALQYFVFGADSAGLVQDKVNQKINLNDLWYIILYIHIATSIIAICTGWLQFLSKLRAKSYRTHRLVGKIYSYNVLLGGLSGLYLSFYATGGWVSSVGFFLLSITWLYTLVRGIRAITVKKDRLEHQRWMTRNYALTFAAVTLRIYLPISMMIFGFESFNDYYRAIAWLCWIPNLIVADWLLYRSKRKPIQKHSVM